MLRPCTLPPSFTLLCLRKCLGETHITKMQLSEESVVLLQAGYQGYRLLRIPSLIVSDTEANLFIQLTPAS